MAPVLGFIGPSVRVHRPQCWGSLGPRASFASGPCVWSRQCGLVRLFTIVIRVRPSTTDQIKKARLSNILGNCPYHE